MAEIDEAVALQAILNTAVQARRSRLTRQLYQHLGGQVVAGPFAGMALIDQTSWGDGDLAVKLLGCYEAELHAALEKAIARNPDLVVNVGCAEGYYALGLARRLPEARIHAFDLDQKALAVCAMAAERNGVAGRVSTHGECTGAILAELAAGARHMLVVMDCEGAERTLLDAATLDRLGHCDLIVELHDFIDRSIGPTLKALAGDRFEVEVIPEAGRNPAAYPFLKQLNSFDRWLMICEFRPEAMEWLACWSRAPAR